MRAVLQHHCSEIAVLTGLACELGVSSSASSCRWQTLRPDIANALGNMFQAKQLFCARYELQGSSKCFTSGSNGVVQFAQVKSMNVRMLCCPPHTTTTACWLLHTRRTACWPCLVVVPVEHLMSMQDPVAIKFYTNMAAYANEKMIYAIPAIADQLGAVPALMDNADGAARSPSGFVFPPHSIAEQGQSLEVWLQQFTTDIVTSMQACPPLTPPICTPPLYICIMLPPACDATHMHLHHATALPRRGSSVLCWRECALLGHL
jgi:hypothetical protein